MLRAMGSTGLERLGRLEAECGGSMAEVGYSSLLEEEMSSSPSTSPELQRGQWYWLSLGMSATELKPTHSGWNQSSQRSHWIISVSSADQGC